MASAAGQGVNSASAATMLASRLSSGSSCSVSPSRSCAILRAIISVTRASSTAKGSVSMPKNWAVLTNPNAFCPMESRLRRLFWVARNSWMRRNKSASTSLRLL